MNFKNFLMIDSLITPHVLRVIYWILQLVILIVSLIAIFSGNSSPAFKGMPSGAAGGILLLIVGSLLLRIYIELLIVIFRIAEDLRELRNIKRNDKGSTII
jgi:hypothetical protein